MSSYLWRYYLENDVGKFQRLLAGSGSSSYSRGAGGSSAAGLTTNSPASSRQHESANNGKPRPGSPSADIVLTKQSLKELDTFGRTILHLACSTPDGGGLPFVEALLSHSLTDPCVQDLESGWTALHRALYHGNISAARAILSNNLFSVKIKDHAGDSPFEVFEASVHGIEKLFSPKNKSDFHSEDIEDEDEIPPGQKRSEASNSDDDGGDEIFAFGSNKNLTLGFPDGDDRSYPERVLIQRSEKQLLQLVEDKFRNTDRDAKEVLDSTTLLTPLRIMDVQLSKFHTAVLTDDSSGNLYVCGFGRGGRLGFGNEQTQFTLRPLASPLLPKRKVTRVALGRDHTVIIFDEGDVWTWGSNIWGQLGYAIQLKVPQDEPIQTTPRQVFGPLKRERVVGCAASRIHTALVTDNSLFTFGKNDGQLGILDSSDARTLASQTTPRKVAATFLTVSSEIRDVAAIDKATAVLLNNEEVWILANFGYYKLKLPFQRGLDWGPVSQFPKHSRGYSISKITGGGDTLCVLSLSGDVFTLDAESFMKESAEKGLRAGRITTARAWSLKKEHMAARDVDVGHDGSIILCTENGSVWRRVKRVKRKENRAPGIESSRYKFERVPGLTKIVVVRSNNFGAYAAIRRDPNIMRTRLLVDDHMLWKDLEPLLPFAGAFTNRKQPDIKNKIKILRPPRVPEGYAKAVKWLMGSSFKAELREYLSYRELPELEDCDILVSTSDCPEIDIPAHKVFLAARSPVLRSLFVEGRRSVGAVGDFIPSITLGEKARLVFKDVKLQTLLILLYYVYADSLVDIWNQSNIHNSRMQYYRVIRSELSSISSKIGLDHLAKALEAAPHPSCSMNRDFSNALSGPSRSEFNESADMIIELASGESVLVHSVIMKARCPFFKALYGSSGQWLLKRREQGIVKVDMKHISKPVMDIVVHWLYSDWGVEGFDGVKAGKESGKVEEFIDLVLEVMSVANELMLGRLCQVCQKILGRYVNTRNAAYMLMALVGCSENGFKDMCMQYICLNMETMLENHLLDELDADLMMDLDGVVKSVQQQLFPHSRTGVQEKLLREIYPDMLEAAAKEKEALIASYSLEEGDTAPLSTSLKNSRVGSYTETLTLFGSPHVQKAKGKASKESIRVGASPAIELHAGGEMIFDMDGEGSGISSAPEAPKAEEAGLQITWASPGTPSKLTRTGWHPSPTSGAPGTSSGWGDVKGKGIDTPSPNPDPQFLASDSPRSRELPTPTETPSTPSKPWGASPALLGDKKLDMKEIMKQASSSRKSNLSIGLSSEEKLAPTKLSQRERKRQAALAVAASPELAIPAQIQKPSASSAKPAWATANTGARVSLKEVLANEVSTLAPPDTSVAKAPIQRTGDGGGWTTSRAASTPIPPVVLPAIPTTQTTRSPPIVPTSRPLPKTAASTVPSQPATPRRTVYVAPVEPTLKPSLADIISQEEAYKGILREHAAKRSLQEIQEEQEFMRWWDAECERVRLETAVASENPAPHGGIKSQGRGMGGGEGDRRGSRGGGSEGRITSEGTGGHSGGSGRAKGRRGRGGIRTGDGGPAVGAKVEGPNK